MKIREYFNTTKEEVESKKYNIFIAICLGNKFFLNGTEINKKNLREYLNWSLEHTKDKVLILIADKIQATNYNVRNKNNTKGVNMRRVLRDGTRIKESLNKLVVELPKDKQNKIKIIKWEEYERQDPFYSETTNLVYEEFKKDKKFKEEVLSDVKTSVTDRKFSEEEYLKLCNYVLDEFSLVYSGLEYEEDYYGMFIYPGMDSTSYFIENLQKGKIFPELNKKLPKEKVALVIMN